MATLALIFLISVISFTKATVKLISSQEGGPAKFSVVDVTDGKTYEVSFPPQTDIQLGQIKWVYDKNRDKWNVEITPDMFFQSPPESTAAIMVSIQWILGEKEFAYVRIGDKWAKHPEFTGKKKKSKPAPSKMFSAATLTETGKGTKKGKVVLKFTTLVTNEYEHPWERNGVFTQEQWEFNAKTRRKSSLVCGMTASMNYRYRPKGGEWSAAAGSYYTDEMQEFMNGRGAHRAALVLATDRTFAEKTAYPIVQARGAKSQIPAEPSTPLVLDSAYKKLTAIGLRDGDMITQYWTPMLSLMPIGADATYTDDVYWNKVRIDQLQFVKFAPHSEYAWVITHADPSYVRFFQEKRWDKNEGEMVLLQYETQFAHFHFGHVSMLLPDEYAKTNLFTVQKVTTGPKTDKRGHPIHYPYNHYVAPVNKLVRMAGSFYTNMKGALATITDDSGHFPGQGRLPTVVKQMKLPDHIRRHETKYTAREIFQNLLRDFGYDEDEYDYRDSQATFASRQADYGTRASEYDYDYDEYDFSELNAEIAREEQAIRELKKRERKKIRLKKRNRDGYRYN